MLSHLALLSPGSATSQPSVGSSRKDGEEKASIERLKKEQGNNSNNLLREEEKWMVGEWMSG